MTRELLILRHGLAEPARGNTDAERRLTEQGRRDVRRIGEWLRSSRCLPGATFASPATRALTTAREALAAGGAGTDALHVEARIYEASRADLVAVVERCEQEPERLLLVGHNPGLEALVDFLTGARTGLASGVLVRLGMPARWRDLEPGCATLVERVDPGDLPGA